MLGVSYSEQEALSMLRLRHWQHLLNEMLKERRFKIPVHLAFGHEAAAVALDLAMRPEDALCLTHRNGCYNLARSKSFSAEVAHYRLEVPSRGGGYMGSMNLAMEDTGIVYSSSILGNNLAVGSGIAMNRKIQRRPGLVFVLTGDGALEEGVFWESLVFATSHQLRMVVVVENNNFSLGSTIEQRRCPIDLSLVCAGIGTGYAAANGAKLSEVKGVLAAAIDQANAGQPSVVELAISTFNQHAGPTPGWPEDPRRIAIEEGFLLGEDPNDPLLHLMEDMGSDGFDRLARRVLAENGGG